MNMIHSLHLRRQARATLAEYRKLREKLMGEIQEMDEQITEERKAVAEEAAKGELRAPH